MASKTIQAGSWFARLDKDQRARLEGTRVAGSWNLETDDTKTRLDLHAAVPNLPIKTVMMAPVPPPSARVEDCKPDANLKGTLLLSRSRIMPKVVASGAPKPPPAVRAFELEIIEGASTESRYRDALRRREEEAFIIMTDFAKSHGVIPAARLAHLQKSVRNAVMTGATPEAVLGVMNRELSDAGLEAAATCARLDVHGRTIAIAAAGGAAPFIVHYGQRVSRVRPIPGSPLGRPGARFEQQVLPFTQNDVLLLGSTAWSSMLERIFAAPTDLALRTLDFALRERRAQPAGGSLVRLTMRPT